MRSLPLPLALTVRVLPVAVLACAGWAWTSGPMAEPAGQPAAAPHATPTPTPTPASKSAPAGTGRTYREPPEPCAAVPAKTVAALVPKADAAGKELSAADRSLRRGCSWSALKGYDYRWLDVSFEIKESAAAADTAFTARGKGDAASGLGDGARVAVALTTNDKQDKREAVVTVRSANALVTVTYNGSDFESHGAPAADEISKGALRAAGDAVAALAAAKG
ncbi:hypothetical protein EOT10_02240 [Streptomyces antnestii]|uniref:DUF3558 domain-containing protein n=1 Tax=Streptomyces antnestii TaxID=2494256 RepID=A0A437Q2H0_9ACTN|nr:hypothetical protein [Streptomyces sp. San01]RVU28712.1 hypothetical protein EOT10_02240 [Streptomyces sp. San01]